MMRSKALFCSFLIPLCMLLSCKTTSKQELQKQVRSDIEQKFDKKARRQGIDYRINKFQLTHRGGNEYKGLLKTTEDGQEYQYTLEVIVDGNSYQWEIVR